MATHAFNDYYIPFIKISPPHARAARAFNDYYIPFIKNFPTPPWQPMLSMIITFLLSKFHPPSRAARAFNDYYIPFIAISPSPLLATHAFNDFLLITISTPFIKISPPLPGQPVLSMIITFLLSQFPPPLLATHAFNDFLLITISPPNPCFQ